MARFLSEEEIATRRQRFRELVQELEDWRIVNGLTKKEVARKLRLRSWVTMHYWQAGKSLPYPRTAYKIMQIMGKPMSITDFNNWSRK